jgi:hypothetical protein
MREWTLAHDVLGRQTAGKGSVPKPEAWEKFVPNLIKYPMPVIKTKPDGTLYVQTWTAQLGGGFCPNWLNNIVTQDELRRRLGAGRKIRVTIDPGLPAREAELQRRAEERERSRAEQEAAAAKTA